MSGERPADGADGEWTGVLPVDKPEGPTSHDAVAIARRALGTRRIGHTGTLDPFASGLLLLCVGPATRLAEYLVGLDKSYRATIRLGSRTDTDDRTGTVLTRSEAWRTLQPLQLVAAIGEFVGELMQVPPTYSAKKVAGERMYDRARRGEPVEVAPVSVRVDCIEVTHLALPDIDVDIDCSSGTYIRAIARDLGELLGTGAHLTALRRTRIGTHRVEDALPLTVLGDAEAVRARLLAPARALDHLSTIEVSGAQARELAHGGPIAVPDEVPDLAAVVIIRGDDLVAIGEVAGGMLRPRKVFL